MHALYEVYDCKHLEAATVPNGSVMGNVLVCKHPDFKCYNLLITTTDFCRICKRHEIEGGK